MLNVAYSHFYKEIQNGVYQEIVFGKKHRHGYSIVPSVEYRKQNLFTKGLDVTVTANYNHNLTTNVDTAMYKYNWLGDYPRSTAGEQNHQSVNKSIQTGIPHLLRYTDWAECTRLRLIMYSVLSSYRTKSD